MQTAVRSDARHALGQHRVTEPIHDVGELGEDRRIDVGDAVEDERIDRSAGSCGRTPRTRDAGTASRWRSGRPGTGARRPSPLLEQASLPDTHPCPSTASYPVQEGVERCLVDIACKPFVDEGEIAALQNRQLLRIDLAIVLGMEDVVHGREADVLVAAAVAGDEVAVEQFVVVGGRDAEFIERDRIARVGIGIGGLRPRVRFADCGRGPRSAPEPRCVRYRRGRRCWCGPRRYRSSDRRSPKPRRCLREQQACRK